MLMHISINYSNLIIGEAEQWEHVLTRRFDNVSYLPRVLGIGMVATFGRQIFDQLRFFQQSTQVGEMLLLTGKSASFYEVRMPPRNSYKLDKSIVN